MNSNSAELQHAHFDALRVGRGRLILRATEFDWSTANAFSRHPYDER
jgi:hypothetical protein